MKKLMVMALLSMSMLAFGKDYKEYKSDVLVSPEIAKEIIEKNKDVVVVDVRPGVKFMAGNVKGSYNVWRPDIESKDGRYGQVTGMRANKEEMEAELNKMGITNNTTIVLIGDNLDEFRFWWIMDLYGAKNMKIVDGGYDALKTAGVATRMGAEPEAKKGDFKFPTASSENTLITFDELKENLNNKEYAIVDTRSENENNGKDVKSGAFLGGAIPGSIWIEWTNAQDSNKMIKPYSELVALYEGKGVTPDKVVVPYCQSAVRSAYTAFILKELLGYKNVRNYDGSWIEWSYEASKGNAPIINGKK